jgi:hypothetical protein
MCLAMNGFYCLKRLRGNEPIAFGPSVSHLEPRPTAATVAATALTYIRPVQPNDSVPRPGLLCETNPLGREVGMSETGFQRLVQICRHRNCNRTILQSSEVAVHPNASH